MKIKDDLLTITTSQRNFAKAIHLSPQAVTNMIKEGIVVRDNKDDGGGVFVVESLKNYYNRDKKTNEVDINVERALHEKAKRQLAELRLEKARGSVYDAKIVERVVTEDLVKIRTRLLNLPSKLAPMIEGRTKGEIDLILRREIEDSLEEMSQFDPSMFISDEIDDEEQE